MAEEMAKRRGSARLRSCSDAAGGAVTKTRSEWTPVVLAARGGQKGGEHLPHRDQESCVERKYLSKCHEHCKLSYQVHCSVAFFLRSLALTKTQAGGDT